MYRFLVADDHPLFRDALRQVIDERWNDAEIVEVSDLDSAKETAQSDDDLDMVLLDLNMPGAEGFSGLLTLRNHAPMLPVVIVSAEESPDVIQRALTCGALGFIPKSSSKERIGEAIESVLSGKSFVPPELAAAIEDKRRMDDELKEKAALLSPAELGVLQLLTMGKPNKIIAFELNIKESTVKAHISSILRKLGVHSRTQAVLVAKNLDF
ncbi:Glycerol metabolism activator [Candidatus Terasakiella magnetica]|uniref:Glycerol metabolism activator n=1 Tax=Candidatus Terasakiella magnetica TaxID=1867952 RepID=A0A1C3RL37_9PROT|nr:response regulator transcription factor [Candidatus Terasakiella magnetica]SCA57986.1 Glycerol metabolism activator [Candidatus Terasakiella magnetica]